MKKELELKEKKIKELYKALEKQNNIIKENEKLREEIINLKLNINKNNNSTNKDNEENISKHPIDYDKSKYNNNLITYNINKNNNYNIINANMYNLDDLKYMNNRNNNISDIKKIQEKVALANSQDVKKEKEIEREKKEKRALERFRKNRSVDLSYNPKEGNLVKSEKITEFAKLLEGHLGGINRGKSAEINDKNIYNDIVIENKTSEMVNIISNKPVVNKKREV